MSTNLRRRTLGRYRLATSALRTAGGFQSRWQRGGGVDLPGIGRSEPIVPTAWAEAATRLLPFGELAVVAGPHSANDGAADHLAELVLAFLHRRVVAPDGQVG